MSVILHHLPELLKHNDSVRLVIIDSLAAHFRGGFETSTSSTSTPTTITKPMTANHTSIFAKRADAVRCMGGILQKLAGIHNLVIIVINEVADLFTKQGPSGILVQCFAYKMMIYLFVSLTDIHILSFL